jgi:hypothetical protein
VDGEGKRGFLIVTPHTAHTSPKRMSVVKKRERAEALLQATKGPLSKAIGDGKGTELPLKGGA